MKRILKNGELIRESRVISADDVFVGTDTSNSLEDKIEEHDDKIRRLEKYTKWYVKYGGMGSGGGGVGEGTTSFEHKLYFKEGSQVKEATGSTVNLWGNGTYTISFSLTKTKGHSFTIRYWLDNSAKKTSIIKEGDSSLDIQLKLTTKTIFGYSIIDNNTEDETGDIFITVIPESYSIVPSIDYKTGGSIAKDNPIAYSVLSTNLRASFSASIFEAVKVFWKIRYKMETETEWHDIDNGLFEYSLEGETWNSNIVRDLTFPEITEENSVGKTINIQLLYGLDSDTFSPSEAGIYNITIIPDGYYVLLSDSEGRIFLEEPSDPTDSSVPKIKKGFLPFMINLCYSSDTSQAVLIKLFKRINGEYVDIKEEGWISVLKTNTINSISDKFKISLPDAGLYRIEASIGGNYKTTKYFVIQEGVSAWSFNQYETGQGRSASHFYYETNSDPFFVSPISLQNNSYEKRINTTVLTGKQFNYNVAIGLQYDKSNDDNNQFLELENTDGIKLTVYQNKIMLGENTIIEDYYLPKTENSDETNIDLWHLLNININFVRTSSSGTQFYYEFTLYIDGVIEGISSGTVDGKTSTALSYNYLFNKLTINPTKKHIIKLNLFDVALTSIDNSASFNRSTNDPYYRKYNYLYDIYATTYYNKYKTSLGIEDKDVLDTTVFSNLVESFEFDEYGIPYTTDSNLSNIISTNDVTEQNKLMQIPVLIMCPNETSAPTVGKGNFFKKWFSAVWPEDPENDSQKPKSVNGYIYYIPHKSSGSLSTYIIRDTRGDRVGFTFDIQGSSTRSFGMKNIELSIDQTSDATTRIFTPNFDKDDTDTFLPERSFTLKADMVDSSTCNNNSIGAFVNSNTIPLDKNNCPARQTVIGGHIKNCLTGFPVLVFWHIDNNDGEVEDKFYFAGIYNFNLGRGSYFNLGYYKEYDPHILSLMTSSIQSEFQILEVPNPSYNDNLAVTEISNGNNFYDFSQFDSSVLFAANENDNYSMFSYGDTIYNNEVDYKALISTAIKYISKGGGYIFETLQKNLKKIGDYSQMVYKLNKDNVSLNCVADYKTQYTRVPGESSYVEKPTQEAKATIDDLLKCIGTTVFDPEKGEYVQNTPLLDLRSTVEYYVICMVFGMVDSVLKNLEIKSWNDKTIFPAFYDMDTSLGVNNNGKKVDFFAFSDYWQNSTELIPGYTDRVKAKGIEIYPDFFNPASSYTGYDIPSSYLFAIAKYATMEIIGASGSIPTIPMTESGSGAEAPLSPVNLYAFYRKLGGCLESAETFMSKYFTNRLSKVPNSFKNLNYRAKYAKVPYWLIDGLDCSEIWDVKNNKTISVHDLSDIGKFNGTGIYKKKDWLESRLHLLDSYFNLNSSVKYRVRKADLVENGQEVVSVTWNDIEKAGGGYYYYPQFSGMSLAFSNDVTMNNQIFSAKDGTKSDLHVNSLLIKAPSFTPIILYQAGSNPISYLIGDDTKKTLFNIPINTTGNQDWGLFGSKALSYINNLGLFRLSDVTISSDNLEAITYQESSEIGKNEAKNFTINTPNITDITFNSDIYSGTLSFNESLKYNRLGTINLTGSKVNCVTTKDLPVTVLNIDKMKLPDNVMEFSNLSQLKTVKLDNSSFAVLRLPMWKQSISITSNDTSMPSTSSYDYHSVEVKSLSILNITGKTGTELRLKDIPLLETVNISGVETLIVENCESLTNIVLDSSIKQLSVINCSNKSTVEYLSIYTNSSENGVIDLSQCLKLENLNLSGTRHFNKVIIGNNIHFPQSAFNSCTELEYIDTPNKSTIYLDGNSVFYYCPNFKLKQSNGSQLRFSTGDITDLSKMFECNNNGSIEYNEANSFLTSIKNNASKITTINKMFFGQPNIGLEINNTNKTFTDLSMFTSIKKADYAFQGCNISYWSKDLYNFGANNIELNGVFYCSKVTVEEDFLSNMANKIIRYNDNNINGSSCTYEFVNTNGEPLEDLTLKNIINLPNATDLIGFRSINCTSIDLMDCFERATKLVNISRFMGGCNKWKNLIYENEVGTVSPFHILSNLKTIADGFYTNSVNEPDKKLDLINLFTSTQWRSMGSIYSSSLEYFEDQLSIDKEIDVADFEYLLNLIRLNSKITSIANLFKNCNIINCPASPTLDFGFLQTRAITTLYHVFDNTKAFDVQGTEIPVLLATATFSKLPSLKTCTGVFANTWIGNENGIPFNLFGRRGDMINTTGYYPNRQIFTVDTKLNEYEYAYYYSTSFGSPELPETVDNETSIFDQTDIFSLNPAENDTWLAIPTPKSGQTNMTRRVLYRIKRTIPKTDITYGNFSEPEIIERFDDPINVEVRYCLYNNRNITNIDGLFENCKYVVPYSKFNFNEYYNLYNSYIKSGDTMYDEYYVDQNCTTKGTFRISDEINDLIAPQCDMTSQVTVSGKLFTNYTLAHTVNIEDRAYPFVPSDFFYGVNPTCSFENLFSSKRTTVDTADPVDNGYIYYALEGYIPEHLMAPISVIIRSSNWIENANIIPVKSGETNNYVFVPQNFIKQPISIAGNLFNFHIRVPSNTADEQNDHIFYVMHYNSLNSGNNQVDLGYLLPRYTLHGKQNTSVIIDGADRLDVIGTSYNFNYHIILSMFDNEGYIDEMFLNAKYPNFVSSDLLYVLSGRIWSPDFTINEINNNNIPTFDSVYLYGTIMYGINKNFIFPKAVNDFATKKLFKDTKITRISASSIPETQSQSIWSSTFNGITIV